MGRKKNRKYIDTKQAHTIKHKQIVNNKKYKQTITEKSISLKR